MDKFVASGSRDLVVEPDSSLTEKISEFTVRRLSSYYRILLTLEAQDVQTVSSARLADLCGVTSAQVRKDLSYFGNFGTRGLGYKVIDLKTAIVGILGLDRNGNWLCLARVALAMLCFFMPDSGKTGFTSHTYLTSIRDGWARSGVTSRSSRSPTREPT